jgi:leucyl aminopeptidase
MDFTLTTETAEKQQSACIVIGVFEKGKLSPSAQRLEQASGGQLSRILQRGDLEGKLGQSLLLYDLANVIAERVLLIGCGAEGEFGDKQYREAVAKSAAAINEWGCGRAANYLTELKVADRDIAWKLRQAVEATMSAAYRFDRLKSKPAPARTAEQVTFYIDAKEDHGHAQRALREGESIGLGVNLVRDLGNLPPNICTPAYLADQALELQKQYGMKTTVLDVADMETLGMGALLSVARGSRQPAKLVTIEYNGGKAGQAPVALVGKGVTFDSGGISIKPAANMDEMKYDMCGAASVLGTLKSIAELKLPLNIVGVIPATENLPDGNASKPGDIVKSMSGQSIEILNTDAEGRLILCDALTYAERFNPAVVIDIATLTGACVVALGHQASGLFSNDDALAQELVEAGKSAYDRAWHLPLWDEYQKQLDSNFADMANVGGRDAGAITAACFLSRFTKKFKWAHLDIAGTAWKTGKEKGATGRPVPLLAEFLLGRAQEQ